MPWVWAVKHFLKAESATIGNMQQTLIYMTIKPVATFWSTLEFTQPGFLSVKNETKIGVVRIGRCFMNRPNMNFIRVSTICQSRFSHRSPISCAPSGFKMLLRIKHVVRSVTLLFGANGGAFRKTNKVPQIDSIGDSYAWSCVHFNTDCYQFHTPCV